MQRKILGMCLSYLHVVLVGADDKADLGAPWLKLPSRALQTSLKCWPAAGRSCSSRSTLAAAWVVPSPRPEPKRQYARDTVDYGTGQGQECNNPPLPAHTRQRNLRKLLQKFEASIMQFQKVELHLTKHF